MKIVNQIKLKIKKNIKKTTKKEQSSVCVVVSTSREGGREEGWEGETLVGLFSSKTEGGRKGGREGGKEGGCICALDLFMNAPLLLLLLLLSSSFPLR